ncbi:SGNH/GDSL hydrolase family protein [Engelhardtia mirabilis]|uniref:SGNH hydrolase-type esterase domain-containing protein n=1 Tax=Engelhardtia mirabilis TaxID=2528011 RepID=A0A518BIG4_9BACT|nr:hypothetical protein Pla133_18090 [Planctomycetes bacterium Pla133]QDV01059.1 hypothetical protein Pla86_18080 [Planctomycetes bacterium Pla86]
MRRRTFFLTLAAIFVGGLGAAEWVVRLRAHSIYGEYLDIYEIHERLPELDLIRPLPNLDVVFGKRSRIETDSHGFRSPELAEPKPGGSLRLAFVGGSTTFCAQAETNSGTWPARVVEGLGERFPEVQWEYLNAGVTGYRTVDSRTNMARRIAPLEPDVVVIYHATNDLAVDSRPLAVDAGLVDEVEPRPPSGPSLLWNLVVKNLRYMAAQEAGRDDGRKLSYDAGELARTFHGHLLELVRECQRSADLVVLVTFSQKVRRDQPREDQLENLQQAFTFMPYLSVEGILEGYEAFNATIRAVAAETGALLIEGEASIPGDDAHFIDSVHFTALGCEAMAQRVLRGLSESGALSALASEAARR